MVYGDTIANAISSLGQSQYKDLAIENILSANQDSNLYDTFEDVITKDRETTEDRVKKLKKAEGLQGLAKGFSTGGKTIQKQFANINENKDIANKGLAKAGAIGGAALSVAPDAIQLGQLASGKSFDTSAEGGGVGSKGSAMLTGAMSGAKIGKLLGPGGMIAGAVGGAILGSEGRKKAAIEYDENLKKRNISEDEIIRARREDDYYMASGRESMGALKNLRKKQLGLLNS